MVNHREISRNYEEVHCSIKSYQVKSHQEMQSWTQRDILGRETVCFPKVQRWAGPP